MAELSYPWTDATGDGGPYAADDWDDLYEILFITDQAAGQGVLCGYLNELAVSGTATPVTVATGGAIVKGKIYKNGAAEDVAVATPAVSTRIDRIVLQADFAAMTVRIAKINGVEGGSAPALTQTDGTKWEISLAQVSITTGGVITVTDERAYCHFGTAVNTAMLDADCVTAAKLPDGIFDVATVLAKFAAGSLTTANLTALIPDDAVTNAILLDIILNGAFQADAGTRALFADGIWTATQIANRTRKLFVPVARAYNVTDGIPSAVVNSPIGYDFEDSHMYSGYGNFYCPVDFVSGMTVKAVVIALGTGNIYCSHDAYHGANGETYATHNPAQAVQAVAATANQYAEIQSLALSGMAAGDHVCLFWQRQGAHANDTISNSVLLQGWIVEYTADS